MSDLNLRAELLKDLQAGVHIRPGAWAKGREWSYQKADHELMALTRDGLCECYAGTYFIRA